ncbi:MAG: AbrB family transcriptional regulator [Geminicoccaceae bacterium]|nr:MAG: AbrB family transcriptional regulator [Geminicoccaceae bacterium]
MVAPMDRVRNIAAFGGAVWQYLREGWLLYALAIAGGAIFAWLHVPLPWMIGALVFTTLAKLKGIAGQVPIPVRMTGQLIVGTAVGLYFTPQALGEVLTHFQAMVLVAFVTIALGGLSAVLMHRFGQVDGRTAYFACMPGGPAEMANLAERAGAAPAPVALSQTLRIAALVLIIPPTITWSGIGGAPDLARFDGVVVVGELLLLGLAAVAAARLLKLLRVPNPWFLGPVAAASVLTASEATLTTMPYALIAVGQLCLGASLGSHFDRAFVARIRPQLRGIVVCTAFLMASCALLAVVVGKLSDLPIAVMILATAPGSLTEMCLTAKALDLSVALVTAFHLVRLFIIVPLTPVIFAAIRPWCARDARPDQAPATGD